MAVEGGEREGGSNGGRKVRLGWGHTDILYKAPNEYTKPQQTIQSTNRLYNAPADYPKSLRTIQRHRILNKTCKMLTKIWNIIQRHNI